MTARRLISLLLFTCFAIYLGHSFIPHYHHAEVPGPAMKGDCPFEHEDQGDPNERPVHCHAFNCLDFVKYDHPETQQPQKVLSVWLIPLFIVEMDEPAAMESQRYIFTQIPAKAIEFTGAISMRAPPFSA